METRAGKDVNNMRKIVITITTILILAALLICMTACGKKPSNGLMKNASPETSALMLYHYDGERGSRSLLFDTDTIKTLLGELDGVKATEAKNWSFKDIAPPIYGLEINATDGMGIFAAWSNGYWITQDGKAYSFKFDFEKLTEKYSWSDSLSALPFTIFPCARRLTQDESGWNSTLLTPAKTLYPPNSIDMTLKSWNKNTIEVSITNNRGEDWMYGEYFSLQVLLDGAWYEMPTTSGHWAFNDIGWIIGAGETQSKTYNLDMYGDLPEGTYRVVVFDLSVENTEPPIYTQDEIIWGSTPLTPAATVYPTNGITMTLESWDKNTVKVSVTNNSGADREYGEGDRYTLQVLVNGVWYEVPIEDRWAFNDVALTVKAGETERKSFNLEMYGELPEGTYRVAVYDLYAENTIS